MNDDREYGFATSIVSYADRGPDGSAKWRGNTTGWIVRDFLGTFHRDPAALFVDPMEGSGTSGDAARALGIRYKGFDLHAGFDAVRDDLLTAAGEPIGSAFLHPAYGGMIKYSGEVWGTEPNPADLSQVGVDLEAFDEMLHAVVTNVHRALSPGGKYGVLLGNWRIDGRYFQLPSRLLRYAPGILCDEIVKQQHNVASAGRRYSGTIVRIAHETLLVFERAADATIVGVTLSLLDDLECQRRRTWRNLVLGYARTRTDFTLGGLYAAFDAHPKAQANPHYRDKLRQVVATSEDLRRLARGRYALIDRRAS